MCGMREQFRSVRECRFAWGKGSYIIISTSVRYGWSLYEKDWNGEELTKVPTLECSASRATGRGQCSLKETCLGRLQRRNHRRMHHWSAIISA
jgi:hypothetical protein